MMNKLFVEVQTEIEKADGRTIVKFNNYKFKKRMLFNLYEDNLMNIFITLDYPKDIILVAQLVEGGYNILYTIDFNNKMNIREAIKPIIDDDYIQLASYVRTYIEINVKYHKSFKCS